MRHVVATRSEPIPEVGGGKIGGEKVVGEKLVEKRLWGKNWWRKGCVEKVDGVKVGK